MAYTLTWSDVTALAPELSTLPTSQQDLALEQAKQEVHGGTWGSDAKAKTGARYLAAHLGTMLKTKGSAPLQSVSAGGVSKTFAMSVASDASALLSTSYGREYQRLLKLRGVHMAVT